MVDYQLAAGDPTLSGGGAPDLSRALPRLARVAESGFRQAGQGLSEMAGVPVETSSGAVRRLPLATIPNLVGGPEVLVASVYLGISGDVEGHMVLTWPLAEARALAGILLDDPSLAGELDDLARSALGEAGNIVGSFFLGALAEATGLRLMPSPPEIVADMGGAILDVVLADLSEEGDEALVFDSTFRQSENEVSALFLVLPRQRHLDVILERLQ